jgi:hypothetical protein
MELPASQPPRSLPSALCWRRVKVMPGIHGPYLLAAPPFGCATHHPANRTMPCFTRLPGCTLPCPFCRFAVRQTTYVGLIDPANKKQPRFVIQGGKRTWESLDGIEPGTAVTMGRGKEDRATILFSPTNELAIQAHKRDLWRVQLPLDIRPYLFHLWQWRELSEHFGLEFFSSIRTEQIEKGTRLMSEDGPARAVLEKPS